MILKFPDDCPYPDSIKNYFDVGSILPCTDCSMKDCPVKQEYERKHHEKELKFTSPAFIVSKKVLGEIHYYLRVAYQLEASFFEYMMLNGTCSACGENTVRTVYFMLGASFAEYQCERCDRVIITELRETTKKGSFVDIKSLFANAQNAIEKQEWTFQKYRENLKKSGRSKSYARYTKDGKT